MTPTARPVVRCPRAHCGGWIQRDSWDGDFACALCNRPARIEDARVVLLEPVDVEAAPWPNLRLPVATGEAGT